MRLKTIIFLTTMFALGLFLALPVSAQDEGDPVRGAELFAANCSPCHGQSGEGRLGATLSDVFVSMNVDTLLEETIHNGRPGTYMPAWGQANGGPLTDEEIEDIIAYIKSWGTTYEPPAPAPPRPDVEIPPVEEVDGDPNNGYTVFQQNCAVCHGEQGEGRIGATLSSPFASIEPGAFAVETISRGVPGSLMPAWSQEDGGPLTDQEINDVAAYLLSIQKAATPTGGEVVGQGSALPLVLAGGAVLVVVIALAVAVQRREAGK